MDDQTKTKRPTQAEVIAEVDKHGEKVFQFHPISENVYLFNGMKCNGLAVISILKRIL